MLEPAATVNGGSTTPEEQLVKPFNTIKLYREAEEATKTVYCMLTLRAPMLQRYVKNTQLLVQRLTQAAKCDD